MLDTMTDGRVIAGMMRGTPNEYVTYNTNPEESRGRFEEALQLIRLAWTETQPFGWQYFKYRSISIWPRPVQDPHPPIYMSGSSRESAEFAAHNRVSLGLAVTTLPLAAKAVQHYREQARLADAGAIASRRCAPLQRGRITPDRRKSRRPRPSPDSGAAQGCFRRRRPCRCGGRKERNATGRR
jgi:alkanesulfonate monooxygenase SsuD/methylene tetrahydromethanopterin reductase-like flavin-dependent oxidoreductase (luciferase family)